jgi:quercetin dioxygenase-like cupin family protein
MKPTTKLKRRDFLTLGGVSSLLPFTVPFVTQTNQTDGIIVGRRVVTGVDSNGKSIIVSDGLTPENARNTESLSNINFLWIEHNVPIDLANNSDPFEGYSFTLEPPMRGVTAGIATFKPGFYASYHRTNTVDFIIVISGRLSLILDESSTILSAGDTVIQRGTNHAWRVIGEEHCNIGFVMISATKK